MVFQVDDRGIANVAATAGVCECNCRCTRVLLGMGTVGHCSAYQDCSLPL